tara:strand:- start:63 stop:1055 length:993 start_codon:yes stop_codon:yes gene_type:complete
MIFKSSEIKKINIKNNPFLLFHGKNEGLKKQSINDLVGKRENITNYDEKEILDNPEEFIENLFNKSLFENEKIIIIKRSTDKILRIINELIQKKIDDIILIINSNALEKKSKLRSFFEKDKKCICVAFYPDNEQALSKVAYAFIKEKNIKISSSNLNLILNKSNGDRENLLNELTKIELLYMSKKIITQEDISKLTNLIENHSINDLIDNCLIKNRKKILRILNENNFNNDESILILRSLLTKCKKILKLSVEFQKNNNLNLTIATSKPPIFWKDQEITKQQLKLWNTKNLKKLIYELNDMEMIIKKNLNNSINLITNFLLEKSSLEANN